MYRIQSGFTLIERMIVVTILGTSLVSAATTTTGGIHWTCGAAGSPLPNRYRPANCRD